MRASALASRSRTSSSSCLIRRVSWVWLLTLFGITLSGLKVYGLEGHGPLATNLTTPAIISQAHADEDNEQYEREGNAADEDLWEEIHETLTDFMLLLIALHILGVFVSSRLHGENLAKAMITGNKESRD